MHSTPPQSQQLPDAGAIAPYFVSEAPTLILDPDPTLLEPEVPPVALSAGCQPDALPTPKGLAGNRSTADPSTAHD